MVDVTRSEEQTDIELTWHYFVDRCSLFHSDTDEFLRTLALGANSHDIGSTLDRNVAWEAAFTDFTALQTGTLIVGAKRSQHCYVQGILEGDRARAEALKRHFLKDLEARPSIAVSGGHMPPVSLGPEGEAGIEEDAHTFIVMGVLPKKIMAEVYISPWYFEAYSIHIDSVEQETAPE